MRVIIPEDIKDITLHQFQRYEELVKNEDLSDLEHNKRAIEIFTNLKYQQVKKISQTDYEGLVAKIAEALGQDAPFEKFFTMNGVEYGFEPNLDQMTQGAYVDAIECTEAKDLHKLMAILFRPVTQKSMGNYAIVNYSGTNEDLERQFKQMPMHIVKGAQGFFLSLLNELNNCIQKSITQELLKGHKLRTTSKNGGGMLRWLFSPKGGKKMQEI